MSHHGSEEGVRAGAIGLFFFGGVGVQGGHSVIKGSSELFMPELQLV